MALAAAAVQGVLFTLLSGTWLRRISVALQTLLLAALIMNLVLIPLLGLMLPKLVMVDHTALSFLPGFWFTGLYEQLLTSSKHPVLLRLGDTALWALAGAAGLFLVTYLPGYIRQARKSIQEPTPSPKGPGWLSRHTAGLATKALLRSPVECAIFHFIGSTITRSAQHRIFLAVYGGFGAALAVMTLSPKQSSSLWEIDFGDAGMLRLPLTLSFVLVSGLRAAFNYPAQLRANWLFQLTETYGIGLYMNAARKWIWPAPSCRWSCCSCRWSSRIKMERCPVPPFLIGASAVLNEVMFAGLRKVPFTCSYFGGRATWSVWQSLLIGFTTYSHAMRRGRFGCCAIPGHPALGSGCAPL